MTNFTNLFNLRKSEESRHKTSESIKNNISFTGHNLWMLACAIIVASVGLNVNSTAVIIGAMLISPLMGPIVGAGFALGTYDFGLLRKSLANILIATVVSLAVATTYFYLSPFKEVQSELLARTAPNIYDVLIAFFGGLAGIIAMTRVEKGNPVPGVAIATALMPPLCTAGYGIATGNWKFVLGAIFLYSINCVFIGIATYSMVKYLKYPAFRRVDSKRQKLVRFGITAITVAVLVPSAFFAYGLYRKQQFSQRAEAFINKEFIANGNTLVYKKINYGTGGGTIELAFLQKFFTENEVAELNTRLQAAGLQRTKLLIRQTAADNLRDLKNDILNEVNKKDNALSEKDKSIALLEQKLNQNTFDNKELLSEINIFFPAVDAISVSRQTVTQADTSRVATIFMYHSNLKLADSNKAKLKSWMEKKLNVNNIKLTEIEK